MTQETQSENLPQAESKETQEASTAPLSVEGAQEPALLQSEDLQKIVETLLFITDRPIKLSRLVEVIENTTAKEVREAISKLQDSYTVNNSALHITEIAGGFQMSTKPEYGRWVRRLYNEKMTTKLSNAALETLAIIAYKQPLTRAEMEAIRGVDVAGPLEKLLDRGLVRVAGRKDTMGHPMVYGTTDEFLRMFGLNKVAELPDLQVFAAKTLENKQEDLPFGEPLPPLEEPRIIPLEELEGEEKFEALDASSPDPFFKRTSYNQGDLSLAAEPSIPPEGLVTPEAASQVPSEQMQGEKQTPKEDNK
jgi:segregation and condensation protein B